METTKCIERDLLQPSAYPERTEKVELIQTHVSFVFLTDTYVYKVKKPVNFGFLDFSTLEKRLYYCNQEILLNRRLSPDIYLDIVPVTDEGDRLVFDGRGPAVDYAVKMKRLPMETLMENLLKENKLTPEMIERVGKKIAEFHASAAVPPEGGGFGTLEVVKTNTAENFRQTEKYIGITISKEQFDLIRKFTEEFYATKSDRIAKRVAEKRIKDCNGDLHMEHICIGDTITIFDCIEFNERFRYSDTASDIAFLAMDLEFHDQYALERVLIDSYLKYSGDTGILNMLTFYKIYRAYVRGKVLSFLLDDEHITQEEKESAIQRARKYFNLAAAYVQREKFGGPGMREPFHKFMETELKPGTLLITCGLPGSWKTETSEEIERIKGFPILRTDLVRLEVLKGEDVFDEKVASDMSRRQKVYDEVFRRADELAEKNEGLILDATFITQEMRRRAAAIADKYKKTFVIMQTTCPEETSIARILKRTKENYESNALTEQAYYNNKKKFEPVDLDDLKRLYPNLKILHCLVDTSEDPPQSWCVIGKKEA